MPINVTIDADELKALLAIREEHAALRLESDELRSTLRLVTAERDLAEERLRAYRRELFGAKGESRSLDQLGLFNEAEALGTNATPSQEDSPETTVGAHKRKNAVTANPSTPICRASPFGMSFPKRNASARMMAMRSSRSALKSASSST